MQYPVFAPGSSEVAVGFFWSVCVFLSIICPAVHEVGFFLFLFFFLFQSLIVSVCILLLKDNFVYLSRRKHCREGSQVPACLTEALPSFLEAFAMVISSLTKEVNETRPREIVHSQPVAGLGHELECPECSLPACDGLNCSSP